MAQLSTALGVALLVLAFTFSPGLGGSPSTLHAAGPGDGDVIVYHPPSPCFGGTLSLYARGLVNLAPIHPPSPIIPQGPPVRGLAHIAAFYFPPSPTGSDSLLGSLSQTNQGQANIQLH